MNRKNLKYFLLLLLSMLISEILNGIVYLLSYHFISWDRLVEKGFISYMTADNVDIISRVLVAIFAIFSYAFIGKIILCKFTDEVYKRKAVIILAVIIVLSYLLVAYFSIQSGWFFYSIHWSMCSPIAAVLLLPFQFMEKTIPMLSEILFVLFSPISVLLIWLFSKINIKGNKKK